MNPNVAEIIIDEGEPLNISCNSTKHMSFWYPTNEDYKNVCIQLLNIGK